MYYLIKWDDDALFIIHQKHPSDNTGTAIQCHGCPFWYTGRQGYLLFKQPNEYHLYKNEDLDKVKERYMLEIL